MLDTYCKVRQWQKDEFLPSSEGYIHLSNREYLCEQPDELNGAEFNLLVRVGVKSIRFRSIDFDFLDKEV